MPSNPSLALRRTGNRAARVCAVLLWLLIGASRAAGADLAGDYTGWIYLDVGDDMPIRAHVEQADGGLRGTLDSPVLGVGGAPTEVAIAGDRLTLTTPDLGGWRVETTVERRDADTLRGRIVWSAGERTLEGEVWLHRVDAELPWVPLDALPDAAGVYPLEDGRSILISERPWGEMRYADTRTGRSGTMLAQTPTTYLIGDRAYDASSIAARATLQLDEGGRVVALEWTDTGAEPRTGARTAFHVEPVSFERGGATLHGEITRLPGGADQPGVVVIGGADWRTAAGLRRHAQVLASFGLTTLTFDKRGWGDSGGDPDCAFEEIAQDLLAGAALLRSRPDVRGAEVGIFGYSQAAWPMAIAASSADDLAFSIMLVPPAVTPAAQETTS
ncbi:MAG: alpha/beta hydrolase family protein, partial [Phycisphaerales bacterium]